jgi:hypothetical protein
MIINGRMLNFLFTVLLFVSWIISIWLANNGRLPTIRKIVALEVLEEAIGRATEMGKPIAYTTGYPPLTQPHRAPGVLAGLSVLGYTAKLAAEHGIRTIVGCAFPDVYTMAQSIVREGYLAGGAPELYRYEDVHYFSPDQYAFATGMANLCEREKPGAVFYIGQPLGERLVIAEGINRAGALGIGASGRYIGSAATFAVLMDYVLIGEELWAASAFVSQDNDLLAGISSQDVGKIVALIMILLSTLLILVSGSSGDIITNWLKI